ncbi:MAG: RagB/SusD family nutrient uptake outer membrane protein [Bacteroidota bacterium]
MTTSNHKISRFLIASVLGITLFSSCKKFVELGPPPTQTVLEDVFKTDATANSAILGLYTGQALPQLIQGFTFMPGMSADDIQYNTSSAAYDEFENNAITVLNSLNENTIWYYSYMLIKNTNNAIEGLNKSTTLTATVKDQLLGEAKFLRAFTYFYLVNFYSAVPMPLTGDADYLINAVLPRTASNLVWAQVIADLKDAQAKLPETYVGTFRARINKSTATTLLAKAYLYQKDWVNAETEASKVIALAPATYSLPAPATAFVQTSPEIIWQIANTTGVSTFGANYLAAAGSIPTFSLYDTIYKSFEAADLRKTNWTGITTVSSKNYYFVNKYKVRVTSGNEYNIVFRLAELYLIRAEARAQQNNLAGAKTDVETIRTRAGLGALAAGITQPQMLLAIEQERKVELFGEWGNRWLDLKRTDRANTVIGGQKATWKTTSVLYPIPDNQRQGNTNLTQNAGY